MISEQDLENQRISKIAEKLSLNSGQSKSDFLYQFNFYLDFNDKYKIVSDLDEKYFRAQLQKIQYTNLYSFIGMSAISTLLFWKFNWYKKTNQQVWKTRLRYTFFMFVPAMVISPFLATNIQSESINEMENISEKYREQIVSNQFSQLFIRDLANIQKEKENKFIKSVTKNNNEQKQ